jgi:hypothetical protein
MDLDTSMAYSNNTLQKTGRRKLLKVGLRYDIFVFIKSLVAPFTMLVIHQGLHSLILQEKLCLSYVLNGDERFEVLLMYDFSVLLVD